MARPKGIVVPKYVKQLCKQYHHGQHDPLYSVASTGRVYGRSHAADCAYNFRYDFPKFDDAPKEVQQAVRYFDRIVNPKLYLSTLRAIRAGHQMKTW